MSETRFKDHVQYALPNLNRLLSNQTSSNQYAKFENYERSDSRFTQISFASSGDENSGEGGKFSWSNCYNLVLVGNDCHVNNHV